MADGFTTKDACDVTWRVYHNDGTTFVYAPSEAIALQRFIAKYPNKQVRKIEKTK